MYVDNTFKSPVVLSFCPGILGLERGLARAGCNVRVAAYVEIEMFVIANLVAGMESGMVDPAPIWTDAKTFDARPFRGRIHGIIGGYPCPGESLAGLREGHLYKGFIWPAIRRSIAQARPLFCFFENVDDHLTGTYPIVQRSLRNMGYRTEAGIYSAEEVGAPHERQRLFILAVADTTTSGLWRHGRGWVSTKAVRASSELGNTKKIQHNGAEHSRERIIGFADTGSQLAVPGRKRPQGVQPRPLRGKGSRISGSITECRPQDFPLGQGQYQYEWEEPRTTEPDLGSTINGYNFRSDLLRALGNSVVEQTAALAWIDLLRKHGFLNQ